MPNYSPFVRAECLESRHVLGVYNSEDNKIWHNTLLLIAMRIDTKKTKTQSILYYFV